MPVSTSASVQQGQLPGETLRDAVERIRLSCLDTLGVPYEIQGNHWVTYQTTPDLSIDEIEAICEAETKAAGLIDDRPRTADEITRDHQRLAKWSECLRSEGYNAGPLISLTEYLASGGIANPLPDIGAMMKAMSKTEWDQLEIDCPQ